MKATFTLTKKTNLEELVERGDKSEMAEILKAKTKAMNEALENALNKISSQVLL